MTQNGKKNIVFAPFVQRPCFGGSDPGTIPQEIWGQGELPHAKEQGIYASRGRDRPIRARDIVSPPGVRVVSQPVSCDSDRWDGKEQCLASPCWVRSTCLSHLVLCCDAAFTVFHLPREAEQTHHDSLSSVDTSPDRLAVACQCRSWHLQHELAARETQKHQVLASLLVTYQTSMTAVSRCFDSPS
ncbi:hypothetical protein VTI74DRAFT_2832 [Chaetomium olivicolor]